MRRYVATALLFLNAAATPVRADTVYEFVSQCQEADLGDCFNRIGERLDQIKSKQNGNAYCLPRAWGATMFESMSYPVSVLEYVRLGLSAARFGQADWETNVVMGRILGEIYPCG
jgi:hypothetical protein